MESVSTSHRESRAGKLSALLLVVLAVLGVFSAGFLFVPRTHAAPPTGLYFDHVLIIVMENEGIWDICHQSPPPCQTVVAPYMASLANNFTIGSQYLGLINTSEPNYVALIGGSLNGCTSSGCPVITAPNLVDRFESVGLTWKGYLENQIPVGCDPDSPEPYTSIHNPFLPYQDISSSTARCGKIVRANPTSCTVVDCALLNDLNNASNPAPNFMWLTPNDCNDMRAYSGCANGCTSGGSSTCITDGDNYLKSLVPQVLASRTFQSSRSVVFITFDEGDGYCPLNGTNTDCLYAVWAGNAAKNSFSSSKLYSQYSFTRTVEANWNLAALSTGDASANPMTEFLNTSTPPPDFAISASQTSISFLSGGTATSTVNLSSLNGFSGTVNLSASVSSSGVTATLSPTSLALSSGGAASSTLTLASSTPGTYTVTVTGTSGSLTHTTTVTVTVQDFTLAVSPSSVTTTTGTLGTTAVTVSPLNGFAGTVSLTSVASPSGPTCSLSPASITGGSGTSTLSCSSSSTGTFTVTVTGSSGSLSHTASVTYTVNNQPDFSVTASPTSVGTVVGTAGTSTITATGLNSFTGTVTLTDSISPATGLTCTLSSTSITLGTSGTSTLSCTATVSGTFTVTVTGTSGSLSHSATVTFTVSSLPDFSVSASPSSLNVQSGSSGTSNINLASLNGFAGTITLSATVSPSTGLTVSFSPSAVTLSSGGTGTCVLTVTSGTMGTYSVTVTGTSGSTSHSTPVSVNVANPDFGLDLSPGVVNMNVGSTAASTVSLSSLGGFSGTVSLSVATSSASLSASLNPTSVPIGSGGTGTAALNFASSTVGSYNATVTASSGTISHTFTVTVNVQDFALAVDQSSITVARGSSGTSTIAVTSLDGFTGTVSLSASSSPSGPKLSLSSSSVTLTPNGSGSSTLTIRALKRTPPGTYTVTITGTSGGLVHTITVTLTIT